MSELSLLELHEESIQSDWIDYNGHMNVAYYVLVFDHATDKFLDYVGLNDEFRECNNVSTFAAEMHVNYLAEVKQGDKVRITTQLLGYDSKRMHYFHSMYHADEGYLAATSELISLYMDMGIRRVSAMPEEILVKLEQVRDSHRTLSVPEQVGHVIGIKK